MSAVVMHGNRATYAGQCDARHARLGVQHRTPRPCTDSVQHRAPHLAPPWVQHRTTHLLTSSTHRHLEHADKDNQTRHAHACKTDVIPTATSRRQPLTYRTTDATTDRAREKTDRSAEMRDPSDPYADERQATGPTAHELWEAQQARQARANRAAAIQACTLCDPDGYRGTQVCDHQDHRPAAQRGIAAIRAKMGWPATGTPTHP